jgi:predicted nucleic acid-binding protein
MENVVAWLIDSSVWIDFTRGRSLRALKQFIAPYILSADAALAEPIIFEVLRHAIDLEVRVIQAQFQTMPCLHTPDDLWTCAARLGQDCRKRGITASSLDLLIAAVAIHHDAELVTFDQDFQNIAKTCALRVKRLQKPKV